MTEDHQPYILLIEDSASQRAKYERELRDTGFPVSAVESPADALAHLKRHRVPVVIVVDWELPGITGLQLVGVIRAMEFRVRPSIVMFTQKDQVSAIVTALNRGADDYIVKPANQAELISRVNVAIRTYQLQAELVEKIQELEQAVGRERIQARLIAEHSLQPARPTAPVPGAPLLEERTHNAVVTAAADVFRKIGLGEVKCRSVDTYIDSPYVGWAGLSISSNHKWVDLCFRASKPALDKLCHEFSGGVPVTPSSARSLLSELASLLREELRRRLVRDGHVVMSGLTPRCVEHRHIPPRLMEHHELECIVETVSGDFLLSAQLETAHESELAVEELVSGLLLPRGVASPSNPATRMLPPGTILGPRVLRRLSEIQQRQKELFLVSALRPSELAQAIFRASSTELTGPFVT